MSKADAIPKVHGSEAQSHLPAQAAQLGESLRIRGDYSGAILQFNEALKKNLDGGFAWPNAYWALAHRAAARGALGDFTGAEEDINAARAEYATRFGGKHYLWLEAQAGEVYRQWARALVTTQRSQSHHGIRAERPAQHFQEKTNKAIAAFSHALAQQPEWPWALAHRGATYTMRYWVTTDFRKVVSEMRGDGGWESDVPHDEDDARLAEKDFEAAYKYNPAYGWAFMFHSFLLGLMGKRAEAEQKLGQAQLAGLDRGSLARFVLMELALYGKDYPRTVQLAWQSLQDDVDDGTTRYFVANGLWAQRNAAANPIPESIWRPAVERARESLDNLQARVLALQGGLDCIEGKVDEARKKFLLILQSGDMEALSHVRQDAAWRAAVPEFDPSVLRKLPKPPAL